MQRTFLIKYFDIHTSFCIRLFNPKYIIRYLNSQIFLNLEDTKQLFPDLLHEKNFSTIHNNYNSTQASLRTGAI